jgi:hypothetical protein
MKKRRLAAMPPAPVRELEVTPAGDNDGTVTVQS